MRQRKRKLEEILRQVAVLFLLACMTILLYGCGGRKQTAGETETMAVENVSENHTSEQGNNSGPETTIQPLNLEEPARLSQSRPLSRRMNSLTKPLRRREATRTSSPERSEK
ncbi:MAG: hypothetical protein ACLTC4_07055 [Hungatella hathewayi]